jgi:hypothetical protein
MFLLVSSSVAYSQFDWLLNMEGKKYYVYTPATDTALNITPSSATIYAHNDRVKSNKLDTLATKKSVQNWMKWWTALDSALIDSALGSRVRVTGLELNTIYGFTHIIYVRANDGDIDRYEATSSLFTTLNMYAGTYIITPEDKYWTTSEGKFITIGE